MLKFAQSNRSKLILFITMATGLLSIIVLWWRSASDRKLRVEAEYNSLSCALYAAEKSGQDNSDLVCKVAIAIAEAGDFDRARSQDGGCLGLRCAFPGPHVASRSRAVQISCDWNDDLR